MADIDMDERKIIECYCANIEESEFISQTRRLVAGKQCRCTIKDMEKAHEPWEEKQAVNARVILNQRLYGGE